MDKIITVILPVYNGGEYLKGAIESLLNQSFQEFELIIINDGSTDDSMKIINYFSNIDDRILVINRENKGLIYTLNEGIANSKGVFIARMDQDDISCKDRLKEQYQFMMKNSLDVCGGQYTVIDKNNNIKHTHTTFQNDFEILLSMASNVPFVHPSVMIRKRFLTSHKLVYGINGYRYAEDLDLWMNMYNYGAKFSNIDSVILKYRILETSMSRVNSKKMKLESNGQFDRFVRENKNNFEAAFEIILNMPKSTHELQRVFVKAILRHAIINRDFGYLYKSIGRVKVSNILLGALSFARLKYF